MNDQNAPDNTQISAHEKAIIDLEEKQYQDKLIELMENVMERYKTSPSLNSCRIASSYAIPILQNFGWRFEQSNFEDEEKIVEGMTLYERLTDTNTGKHLYLVVVPFQKMATHQFIKEIEIKTQGHTAPVVLTNGLFMLVIPKDNQQRVRGSYYFTLDKTLPSQDIFQINARNDWHPDNLLSNLLHTKNGVLEYFFSDPIAASRTLLFTFLGKETYDELPPHDNDYLINYLNQMLQVESTREKMIDYTRKSLKKQKVVLSSEEITLWKDVWLDKVTESLKDRDGFNTFQFVGPDNMSPQQNKCAIKFIECLRSKPYEHKLRLRPSKDEKVIAEIIVLENYEPSLVGRLAYDKHSRELYVDYYPETAARLNSKTIITNEEESVLIANIITNHSAQDFC